VAGLLSRLRVPQVVILILGGIVIEPEVLGWSEPESIELVSNVGLGFLFLLAGYELELGLFRQRAGRLAFKSWLVTALVAIVVTGAVGRWGFVHAFVPIALGLTTTALQLSSSLFVDSRQLLSDLTVLAAHLYYQGRSRLVSRDGEIDESIKASFRDELAAEAATNIEVILSSEMAAQVSISFSH
jgi:Kef-type K+ transport system membrane component KefB